MEILNGKKPLLRAFPFLLLTLVILVTPGNTIGQEQDEYAVKAAFIFNFSKFAEWPQTAGSGDFEICILGENPFDANIDKLTRGKSANGRPIRVRRIKEPADAKSCQIAFVTSAERVKAVKLLEVVRGTTVLTVGEKLDFLRMGGMIALPMEDSHVAIVINTGAIQSAGIKVSAKLLTLARIYKND